MGRKFSIILDNREEVEIMKALCELHNALVTNVSGYFEKIYFELVTDSVTAMTIDNEFTAITSALEVFDNIIGG